MEPIASGGALTLLAFSAYAGVVWWAYRAKSRARFEQDGWLVFDDDERPESAAGPSTHPGRGEGAR